MRGPGAGGRLKTQGYDDPRSDSSFAARVTAEHLGAAPDLAVAGQVPGGFVDDAAAPRAGEDLTRRLAAQPQVSAVSSYWRGPAASLRSRDGRSAVLLVLSPPLRTPDVSRPGPRPRKASHD
ncbi:hypothetical protein AB0D71_18845 [Streptomyces avermitilis]|uniref:hypothetical protein n=1 Tax=Streptomyces avermitilis TaxID=33903 RepID=UPI003410A579